MGLQRDTVRLLDAAEKGMPMGEGGGGGLDGGAVSPRSSFAASRRLHAQRKEALMKEALIKADKEKATSVSSVSCSVTSLSNTSGEIPDEIVAAGSGEGGRGNCGDSGGAGDGEALEVGDDLKMLPHGGRESGEVEMGGVGGGAGWAAARGSGGGALRSFDKLSVEVPVTPGMPAVFLSHSAMNMHTNNAHAPSRSPSRQSNAASVVAEVEEEVMVDDPAGWDSASSGSVYQPSPRSPPPRSPKEPDSPSASPSQYLSNKYEDHDDVGPVKVYTHTTAPRAIFPVD